MLKRTLTKDVPNKIGETVLLKGWIDVRRDHGKLIFIDLRDRWGVVQIVFSPETKELLEKADKLRPEWVVSIEGEVSERPEGMKNQDLATGAVEIKADSLEILNEAETLPFEIDGDGFDIGEDHRMKYRYLDLRRPRLAENMRKRHEIIKFMRDFLTEKEFVEIETPILTKSTPEGARDYVVPSRQHPGRFYALPQSPQQYKQLLMVSGIEKYFQIARCFRDEDTRGDRQPEFSQLDIEASFLNKEDIMALIENLFTDLVRNLFPSKKISKSPFPRLKYKEAMDKYGTDRPDLREDKNNADELAFAFVTDFPMFEKKEDGSLGASHHPFTKIRNDNAFSKEIIGTLKKDPESLASEQYDLVLNGEEVAGGSIREHMPGIISAVFETLGYETKEIERQFGHLLGAFKYGVPPHGGIAVGLERLIMVLQGEPNIREVIAFPKTGDGGDLMMDSPSDLSPDQLSELNLKIDNKHK